MSSGKAQLPEMEDLHATLARVLKERIQKGEATAADLSVARQFLKDNGIEVVGGARAGTPLGNLAGVVPFDHRDADEAAQG